MEIDNDTCLKDLIINASTYVDKKAIWGKYRNFKDDVKQDGLT